MISIKYLHTHNISFSTQKKAWGHIINQGKACAKKDEEKYASD
jgi:hypothetical protein